MIFLEGLIKDIFLSCCVKGKTRKRLEKKWENLPRYFVDSSVFVEAALKQERYRKCMAFFNKVGYKYRIETSIVVLGEIVRRFDRIKDVNYREELFRWLDNILVDRRIVIHRPSRGCFTLGEEIFGFDTFIGPVDALVFVGCVEEKCADLVTLDSDFSDRLGKKYGVKILNL